MAEFTIPDFLQGQSPEEIHEEMIEQLPNDIDLSAGGDPFNLTFPTAYEISRFIQFRYSELIKLITPQYCQGYDEMADEHGKCRSMERKKAISATGVIEVTATAGTTIPKGSIFSTASINGANAVEFKTTDPDVSFETEETKSINIEAVVPGKSGNVQANTIIVKSSNITGIKTVINSTPTTGGMEEETLDDFIARMVEYDQTQGQSYIGNAADYKRWAEETDGVGHAEVKMPITEDDIITIIITDLNGDPADKSIRAAVYNKIMSPTPLSTDGTAPDGEVTGLERLATINAQIQVISPTLENLTLSVSIKIDTDITNSEAVKTDIANYVKKYLATTTEYVYVSQIGSIISNITGIIDYDMDSLLINNQTENIPVGYETQYSITADDITINLV